MRTQAQIDEYIENLDNDEVTIEDFERLCDELKNNTLVTHLDFGKLSLLQEVTKGRVGRALESLLANNTTLTHLNLNHTHISASDIELLANGLYCNPKSALISLGLNAAEVDDESDIDGSIETLLGINRLHHLDLSFAQEVNVSAAKTIGIGLGKNTTLKSLALPIIDNDFGCIFRYIEGNTNTALETLDMSKSSIDEFGMRDLKMMLEKNHSLTSLILRFINNYSLGTTLVGITELGLQYLCEGMESNRSVIDLDFFGSMTTVNNLSMICEFLKKNTHVKKINLGCNQITNDSVELIAGALQVNTTLTSLDLSGNQFDYLAVTKLEKALEKNYSLLELKLFEEGNAAATAGVELSAISALLERNKAQRDIIANINEGMDTLTGDDIAYKLNAYLNKAQTQLHDKHPDKETVIKNINTKIEALSLSLKRSAGDEERLSFNKVFKTS